MGSRKSSQVEQREFPHQAIGNAHSPALGRDATPFEKQQASGQSHRYNFSRGAALNQSSVSHVSGRSNSSRYFQPSHTQNEIERSKMLQMQAMNLGHPDSSGFKMNQQLHMQEEEKAASIG